MKKPVGIITTFRQQNWGSVLQAYALQQAINSMGFQCEVIDYKYPNEYHYSRGISRSRSWLRNLPGNCWLWLKRKTGQLPEHKMKLLDRFIVENMQTTKVYRSYEELHKNPPLYDIYVAGSDQIWNPNTMTGDMSYMLDFVPDGALKISYASSFACEQIPDKYKKDYVKYLTRMDGISVRERNGARIVKDLINRDVPVVLDPTLLLDASQWLSIARKAKPVKLPEKYILCYMLGYTYNPDKSMSLILHQLQRQYQMPVIAMNQLPASFHGEKYKLPKSYGKGIEEFLMMMSRASIIVSSSFHGTAFALNFGRPLIALADGSSLMDDRIPSLMSGVGLKNHVMYSNNPVPAKLHPEYDVETEQRMLGSLRADSLKFLKEALW